MRDQAVALTVLIGLLCMAVGVRWIYQAGKELRS